MASSSSTKQQSSRFSSFKVFKFTGSKPPRPPPKDPSYLYSASCNPSLASVSNHSLYSQPPLPSSSFSAPSPSPRDKTKANGALSIRSASPTPSRALQSSPQHRPQQQQPPPSLSVSSTLTPDSGSGSGKMSFFRKMSTLGKRSASKSPRVTSTDDGTDNESISRPWNVQHHIHIDESFQGIPPAWTSTLAGLGYSEAEIALILKGRRNRVPDLTSVQDDPSSTKFSRSRSPSTTISVNRSTSLRRQRSDGSIARSERSMRSGPPVPPPPLPLPPPPLPPPPQSSQAPNLHIVPPVAPPPTPASAVGTPVEAGDVEVASSSEAQYVYVNHPLHTANGPVAVPPLGKVPVIQPAPVRQQPLHSNSSSPVLDPPSPSVKSSREQRLRTQPAPRRQFRVVNKTSPPPVYSDDRVLSGSPPPITLEDALQPRPEEKSPSQHPVAPNPTTPTDHIKTPPQNSPPANGTLHRGTVKEQGDGAVHSSNERYRTRPTDLSILPPRVSLRKDTLEDLSSWSASLFSSLPSALHDSPASSVSTAPTSAATPQVPQQENTKHRTKPSLTLPTIVLPPGVQEEDEDEHEDVGEGENEEDATGNEYSHSASPLYHELMGMMQERATVSSDVGSPGPGSPASPGFQIDAASLSSHGTSSRDSQLTIRFDSGDSNRDSSASISTITHATIVRGASIARRVRADVVTNPRSMSLFKGKERASEQVSVPVVEEDASVDEDEGDSSSDAACSDEDGGLGSPVDSFAFTSGPNSQEDGGNKSPRRVHVHGFGSPLPSPASSPLRACFPEPGSVEPEPQQDEETQDEETLKESTQAPYVTPPPSAPVTVRRPPIAIATDLENLIGVSASSLSSPPTEQDGPVLETTPRYPSWLAAGVLPLAEFIDDSSDPRALFTDLQEIAQGESGSVYSACAAPTITSQFRPPTPTSPVSEISPEGDEADEDLAQSKQGLVAIKCVPLLRGSTEKLADLRRELELARALRHANVLRMERLYVDVAEESLWIGMELMDRSLADVLSVVGEDVGSALVAPEAQEEGGDGPGGGAEVVEISEKMVARFVRDVLLALSYIHKHHIAHRDVRSDNLLLSKSGVLKLSDFSNAVCSPTGTPKRSDSVGVIYWQAPEMRTGLYDPLKVDVWSLGATTWELVHGHPPFEDVKDTRDIVGGLLPPVREPEAFSRSFHDFLHSCSQPAASRPDPDELLDAEFVRTACPRSEIVQLLGQCRAIDEQQIRRQSNDL